MVLPGRNATMGNFVSLLQRAILDRPVVDKTGLSGRYDFDLQWAPDETKLVATRGPVDALVVDQAERPTAN